VFKKLPNKHINLIIDTTYFGRGSGYMIFRADGHNIYFDWTEQERVSGMAKGLDVLESWGYSYKSFTIDGRKGFIDYLKMRYPKVPIQFCQFHQKQIIRRCITNKPQTACGEDLKAIMRDFCAYDYDSFNMIYTKLRERWDDFLKEKK
jgi:transposase-like protein